MRRALLTFVAAVAAAALLAGAFPASAASTDPPLYVLKWGEFGTGDGQMVEPEGIAVAPDGKVYVADTDNDRILRFNSVGVYELAFGAVGSGNSQFLAPRGVAVDTSGNVYVADTGNDRVQKFNGDGQFITVFGGPGITDGLFDNPSSIAFDPSGDLYVADSQNNRIQRFTASGAFVDSFGSLGTGDGMFTNPRGVGVDTSGNVYVADTGNNRVQKFDDTGTYLDQWGGSGTANGLFNAPRGLAVDAEDQVWVADSVNHRLQIFSDDGTFVSKRGTNGTGNGQFDQPGAVAISPVDGRAFVADTNNDRVQKLGPQIDFLDVPPGAPFYDQISWIAAGGYANGYATEGGAEYRPTNEISRMAMAAFLYRLAGSPPGPFDDPGFPDVPVVHPFFLEISWLAQSGITTGYADGTFKPAASIRREAMAAFMFRYRLSPEGDFPDPGFSDIGPGDTFYDEVAWAADEGIVNGFVDGTFRPTNPVTRQAMASFLFGLSELGPPLL